MLRPDRDLCQRLDETLLWMCAVPSPIGEEDALCAAVEAHLASRAAPPGIERIGHSLVVPLLRHGSERPHVVLAGHLDTVRTDNGPARIADGRCFGAGASDMKSGLAVMTVLAEELTIEVCPFDLTLVYYAREEGPFLENELGPVLERSKLLDDVTLAICLEPSDNKLALGCNGSLHAEVTFRGRTAHSSRPWEGDNAVHKACGLLGRVASLSPKPVQLDGLTYRAVTTVTQARDGGRGRNVVPDVFTLNLNHRFTPDTTPEEAMRHVRDLAGDDCEVRFTDVSPGALPSATHPLVDKLLKSGARAVEPKQAWTDVARFAARGTPAVNFGPGENAQAHQKNESTSLELVHEGYAILRRFLCG
jgi:succinyl-diaminopimelate desuccinylase